MGLGAIWKFPYLVGSNGGSAFLFPFIILTFTIGLVLLIAELTVGRAGAGCIVTAFRKLGGKHWGRAGYLGVVTGFLVLSFYSAIGGWTIAYFVNACLGSGLVADQAQLGAHFASISGDPELAIGYQALFLFLTAWVVAYDISKGIERISKVLMPILAVISVFLMIYVLCQPGALEGVEFLFKPDFSEFGYETLLAALGQLFYSLSLAMGIMITYGSYMKKEVSVQKSSLQIAICDSAFAIVAATIIIPSIFAFSADAQGALDNSGPSLMFVQLPAVFNNLPGGQWIGAVFFVLVFFAALTSSISLVEAIVAVLRENLHLKRWVSCCIVFGIVIVLGVLSSLGFGVLSDIKIVMPSGSTYQLLDMFDYLSNSILMPIVAILTCILAGYFIDKNLIPDEIGLKRKGGRVYFRVMVRYIAPVCMAIILISGIVFNLVLPPL